MHDTSTASAPIYPLATDTDAPTTDVQLPPELLDRMEPLQRVDLMMRYGSRHSALRELQRMLSHATDAATRVRCYFKAGQLRERMQEWDAARSCYEEAVARVSEGDGDAYLALNNLAYCQNRLRRHDDAEQSCRRAISIDPSLFHAHKNLGIALEALGRFAEAADSYHRAFQAAPHEQVAFRRLRFLLARHPEIRTDRPDVLRVIEGRLAEGRRDWPTSQAVRAQEDQATLRRLLASILVHEPLTEGDVQVFGLGWQPGDGLRYRTLDEVLSEKGIEVMEVSESGSVPTIRVVNHTDSRVFAMAGEGLVGAKQNRVLNASILLEAGADLHLPVSCVERGRWSYRTRQFESHMRSSHYALRHMMSRHSYEGYRAHGTPGSDQSEVWGEVERLLSSHGTKSPSSALHDAYEQAGERLEKATERLKPRADWCGAAFAFGGSVVGVDLFDKPKTLERLWPMLIRAYALDVLQRPDPPETAPQVTREHVSHWVRSSGSAVMDAFSSPGLGLDVRLESDRHVGAALMVDGMPLHLEMFFENDV
ncbi:MAG TPA: tetratricopeptide repeat protein [Candidatus Eisenbacteria bacterium]|nr:tetratricopeptide repeat protein [Candidatus Eisenbacteria bacterium]